MKKYKEARGMGMGRDEEESETNHQSSAVNYEKGIVHVSSCFTTEQ